VCARQQTNSSGHATGIRSNKLFINELVACARRDGNKRIREVAADPNTYLERDLGVSTARTHTGGRRMDGNEFCQQLAQRCNINVIRRYTNKLITHKCFVSAEHFFFYRQHAHLCGPALNSGMTNDWAAHEKLINDLGRIGELFSPATIKSYIEFFGGNSKPRS
jgi:hypothetical protein